MLNIFIPLEIHIGINFIEAKGDINLLYNFNIGEKYNEFFDFTYPTLITFLNTTGISIIFSLDFFKIDLKSNVGSESLYNGMSEENLGELTQLRLNSNGALKSSSETIETSSYGTIWDFIYGLGFVMSTLSTIVAIICAILPYLVKPYDMYIYLIGISLFLGIIAILIVEVLMGEKSFNVATIMGMAIGCLICADVYKTAEGYITNVYKYMYNLPKLIHISKKAEEAFAFVDAFLKGIDICLGLTEIIHHIITNEESADEFKIMTSLLSLGVGITTLYFSFASIVYLKEAKRDNKAHIANIFSRIALFAGIVLFALGITKVINNNI